jgi:hypothetical protein
VPVEDLKKVNGDRINRSPLPEFRPLEKPPPLN